MATFTLLIGGDFREQEVEFSRKSVYLACQSSKLTLPVEEYDDE